MSSDDFERRINNKIETIVETQGNLQEAIAELIKAGRIEDARIKENGKQIAALMEVVRLQSEVARSHDERLDRIDKQQEENGRQIAALHEQANERLDRIEKLQEENSRQIAALREQGKEQDERINAFIEQRKETREDMKQMRDAINVLIRIVEGHISNHP